MDQVYTYYVREYKYKHCSLHKVNIKELFEKEKFSIKIKCVDVDYIFKYDALVVNKSDDINGYVTRKNKKLLQLLRSAADFEIEPKTDGPCRYLNFRKAKNGFECGLARSPVCNHDEIKVRDYLDRSWNNESICYVCMETVKCFDLLNIYMCCGAILHSRCGGQMSSTMCPICR